jgi:hypothetical protein
MVQKNPSLLWQGRDVEKKFYYVVFTEGILPVTESETHIIRCHVQAFFKEGLQSI